MSEYDPIISRWVSVLCDECKTDSGFWYARGDYTYKGGDPLVYCTACKDSIIDYQKRRAELETKYKEELAAIVRRKG